MRAVCCRVINPGRTDARVKVPMRSTIPDSESELEDMPQTCSRDSMLLTDRGMYNFVSLQQWFRYVIILKG